MKNTFLPIGISTGFLFLIVGITMQQGTPQYIVLGSAMTILLITLLTTLRNAQKRQ